MLRLERSGVRPVPGSLAGRRFDSPQALATDPETRCRDCRATLALQAQPSFPQGLAPSAATAIRGWAQWLPQAEI